MASTTSIVPAATPPPGQASNFLDPVTQEDAIIAVSAVFLALTLFVVGIRLYFSARITHTMGVEDYVCLAASVSHVVEEFDWVDKYINTVEDVLLCRHWNDYRRALHGKTHLPFEKKLGISVLFTTGVIVVIASVVGIVYRVRLTFGRDITWNQGAFDAISIVEINTAIICSSMPACASFFKYLSAKSTLFASVRATLGRSKPSGDSNANESRSRHKSQTWLTLKTPSASRHHLSSNSWQKIDPGKLGSCTQIASSAWPDPESNPEIRSEQPESEPVRYKADVANIDEESRANGIMKSITVNITSQKNQCER
ncbi:hypothetical protein MMC07_007016 [Pseudocyphellaria aurata]|nr:hypothetical protein [Pseudocyphellaria aurata]